jgi:hypothetical protein
MKNVGAAKAEHELDPNYELPTLFSLFSMCEK